MALQFIDALRNTILDAINTAANAGAGAAIVGIYSGTKPATVATALSGNTLLAKITCADPFAAAASSGTIAIDADPDLTTTALDTNTATWFRLYSSADGSAISEANAIMQGTVGTSGADINLNTTSIVSGGAVTITSWVLTAPGA